MKYRVLTLLFLTLSLTLKAAIRLPAIISESMVLKQKSKAALWGWADPGEEVIITSGWGAKARAITPASGKWMTHLKTPQAGGPYTLTFSGKNTIQFNQVLIGEVWVCSGQSNMQWPISALPDAQAILAHADVPMMRLFDVKRETHEQPQRQGTGVWKTCDKASAKSFSAVAYFFGKQLEEKLDVPIGLILTAWGASSVEAWIRAEEAEKIPSYDSLMNQYRNNRKHMLPQHWPTQLYNAMLHPLMPYDIKGVIWYQGESNITRPHEYRQSFAIMIKNWRKDWGIGEFPFYYVQIAPFAYANNGRDPLKGMGLPALREAQLKTLELKNTGMAVTMDIGNTKDIHPAKKKEVGKRLALWALAKTYKQKGMTYSGPLYKSMKVKDHAIVLSFRHTDGGLKLMKTKNNPFLIAGKDRKFKAAEVQVVGHTLRVAHPATLQPVAVRYGWKDTDEATLFNGKGLPASSFRTDDWAVSD